jgi:nitrite reductase/ring-hydroxylating ferredoxin subunit
MGEWYLAARLEDIPEGKGLEAHVNGMDIALFKVDGIPYAMDNICPHRQGPIAEGELDEDVVSCPWHAWEINVRTGKVVYNPKLCSQTFPCKVENGEVLVEISENGRNRD